MIEASVTHSAARARQRRSARIAAADGANFDLLVLGGGVHGAYAAREAALAGLRVLLLEARDFAGATSSRSSKLLHGGIRYLEQGSFGLVRHALRQRSYWNEIAPHLTRRQPFIFPVIKGLTRPAWQINIGLSLYDLLYSGWRLRPDRSRMFPRHSLEPNQGEIARGLRAAGMKFGKLFRYYDAQMDDFRLVLEAIRATEERGEVALNYAEAQSINRTEGGWNVGWVDKLSGTKRRSEAKYLINCCGPWAGAIHEMAGSPGEQAPPIVWSRGIHLYFRRRLGLPALILPTGEPGRVYWVLPYFYGGEDLTFVGTTDRSASKPEHDPLAAEEETAELLSYLARDLPGFGFSRSDIVHTICGIRTLVGKGGSSEQTASIGREEHVIYASAYSALFGGKFTTAPLVARNLVQPLFAASVVKPLNSPSCAPLPGAAGWSEHGYKALKSELAARFSLAGNSNVSDELLSLALFTLGMQASALTPSDLSKVKSGISSGASPADLLLLDALIDRAAEEQAHEVEDFFTRRIPIYTLGPDLAALKSAARALLSSAVYPSA